MIDRLQQGGMITAPDPRPYRAPLQGLNPEAFRYNLKADPLDTKGMVQVLQFNENADIRRQQQAVLLEQAKIKKEIEEAKLAFQKDKLKMQMLQQINKMAYGSGAPIIDTKGQPLLMDIDGTNFVKTRFADIDLAIEEKKNEIYKLWSKPLEGENMNKISKVMDEIVELRSKRGSDMDYGVEKALSQTIQKLLIGDVGSGNKVNPYILDNVINSRDEFFKGASPGPLGPGGSPTGWVFGNPSNIPSYVLFNPKEQSKKFEDLVTGLLTPISQDEVVPQKTGPNNVFIKTKTNTLVRSLETVVNDLANTVSSNGALASFLSDQYGVNLFNPDNTVNAELLKKYLHQNIKPQYEAAMDESKNVEKTLNMGAADAQVKKTIIEGNYNTNINKNTEANVNHSFTTKKIMDSKDIPEDTKEDLKTVTEVEQANIDKAYEIIKSDLNLDPQKGKGAELISTVIKILKKQDGVLSYNDIEKIVMAANLNKSVPSLKEEASKTTKKETTTTTKKTTTETKSKPTINPKSPPGINKAPKKSSGIDW